MGVYKDRWGFAATVKVNGVRQELRFPKGTPLKTIRARREELRVRLRTLPQGERRTLAHDAGRYREQVKSTLVSFKDRHFRRSTGRRSSGCVTLVSRRRRIRAAAARIATRRRKVRIGVT